MFFVTVSGQYNDDDVPKYENGTLQVCSDAEITTYTEFQCTQYAALTARNPSSCIGYLRVPSGWTLAPDTLDTRNAVVAASAAGVSFGSQCVVLAGGKGVNVKTGMDCGSGLIKVFKDDSSCFNVACEYVMLIKGQTLGRKLSPTLFYPKWCLKKTFSRMFRFTRPYLQSCHQRQVVVSLPFHSSRYPCVPQSI
jgi:hypothetical protein